MIPTEKSAKVIVQGGNGRADTMKLNAPKGWAALMAAFLLLGLLLFLVLPFRPALFLYTLTAGLAYVLGKTIEARAVLGRVARWL